MSSSATAAAARRIIASTSCPASAVRISSAVYRGSSSAIGDDRDRLRELPRVRHREVDRADAESCGALCEAAGEVHGRLRTSDDLDLSPSEGASDPEAERLAD